MVKATFIMYFFKKKVKIPDEINDHLLGRLIPNEIFEIDRHLFHKFALQNPLKMNFLKVFRWVSMAEGISLLILLGIAMPLKYSFDLPQMVASVGMIHGILFVVYVGFAWIYKFKLNWPYTVLFLVLVAAVLPFGTFYADRKYLKKAK
jgi:integral membrane protein